MTNDTILEALWDFAHDRPGIRAEDYLVSHPCSPQWFESRRALWRDRSRVKRHLKRFERLYASVGSDMVDSMIIPFDWATITKGQRLQFEVDDDRHLISPYATELWDASWEYTPGQNGSTEYRWACAELLDDIFRAIVSEYQPPWWHKFRPDGPRFKGHPSTTGGAK